MPERSTTKIIAKKPQNFDHQKIHLRLENLLEEGRPMYGEISLTVVFHEGKITKVSEAVTTVSLA